MWRSQRAILYSQLTLAHRWQQNQLTTSIHRNLLTSPHFRKKCNFQLVKLPSAGLTLCGFEMCCEMPSPHQPPWFWAWAASGYPSPGCRASTSAAGLPSSSKPLICVLIWIFSSYWLALLLTSDYFLTKLKSAKFAMTGMNLVTAGAVGKCVSADKTPHTPHLAQHNPYTAPDTAPEKNVGEKGQALRAGPSVHMNSGNHFHGSSAKQAIPYLLFLYRCLCY